MLSDTNKSFNNRKKKNAKLKKGSELQKPKVEIYKMLWEILTLLQIFENCNIKNLIIWNYLVFLLLFLDQALVYVWQAGVELVVQVLFVQGKKIALVIVQM